MIKAADFWLCPLCGLKEMKYGSTCLEFKSGLCPNIDKVHLTGQYYLHEVVSSVGLGISEISNETNTTRSVPKTISSDVE